MTPSVPHLVGWLFIGSAIAALEGRAPTPRDPVQPPASSAQASPAAPVRLERFVDRVWIVDAATAVASGTRYVFLSDNVLVVAPTGGTPLIGTWAEDVDGLVTTEKGRTAKVDVLELTAERFRIRVNARTPYEVTLVPAISPPAAPAAPAAPSTDTQAAPAVTTPIGPAYRCGADTFRLAFEGNTAYLTWPDNTVLVLKEVSVGDAPASRRTYSDGEFRVVEDTSEAFTRVMFARPGFRPRPCSSAR